VKDGDVNGDNFVTGGDAQMAFQIAIGMIYPTFEQQCAADCNDDDWVTGGDAQAIFQTAIGMGSCADPMSKQDHGSTPSLQSESDVEIFEDSEETVSGLIWLERTSDLSRGLLWVDVMVSNPESEIDVFTLSLSFDSRHYDFLECYEGSLNPEWLFFDCNEIEPGQIIVSGVSVTGVIPQASNGHIASLVFEGPTDSRHQSAVNIDVLQDNISEFEDISDYITTW